MKAKLPVQDKMEKIHFLFLSLNTAKHNGTLRNITRLKGGEKWQIKKGSWPQEMK